MAFPGGLDRPAVAGAMQGASILNLERRGAAWAVVDGGYQNRRLTAATLCRIGTTPVTGLIGVTGGCATPWGSLLLAEGDAAAWRARLPGMHLGTSGMVVEVEPEDPVSVPVKHPALGAFGAADLAAGLSADGRAVVWMTDGRPGGFLYRFVSDGAAGRDALSAGRLAAARIDGGALRWLPLAEGDPLIAARNAGATGFDRPAGLALDLPRRRLCLAVNGGAGRVLGIRPAAEDLAAESGVAETLLEGRAPAAGNEPGAWPYAPATLAFDRQGALLVGTDRAARPGPMPEGLFRLPVEGPGRGRPERLLAAPVGGAIGGAAEAPDGVLLAAVAHPGAAPGASWERPATRWPEQRDDTPPRSAIVTLAR
jgi:secreted PhoX family phosphatase